MKKKLIAIGLCLVMGASLAACGGGGGKKADTVKLKLSVTTSETGTWTAAAKKFADDVKKKTDGRIQITVYPNEQLSSGNQAKGVEQVSNGTTDMSIHSNIIWSALDQKFSVPSLPFLISSAEAADKAVSGAGGEAISQLLDAKNVVALGFGESGYRQVTNNTRPIKSPADMKGMKLRVPGMKMYIDLYKALGADPISMNFAEVFTALQQGTIEGQENPVNVIESSKIQEVQKYMSIWDYSYDMLILSINKNKFNSLSKEDQEILKSCGEEAMKYQKELNRSQEEKFIKMFKEKGVEVTPLEDIDIAAFKKITDQLYAGYEKEYGADLIAKFKG